MGQETLNHIKELTDKPEVPHVTAQIPVIDLNVYPELIEALPSIEEDFFGSPLTDKERKNALYSCYKNSSMNYIPSPLNDSATRPIDFYVHRRIQDNPTLDTAEDPETMFASTMRALLLDIAATVTQTRLDNIHRKMSLPGKPQQLISSDTKPLMDQEILDALVASKKPAPKKQRVQPFCKRQQNSVPRDAVSSSTATAHSTNAATTPDTTSSHQDRQSSFCGRGRGRGRWRTPNYVQIGVGKAHRQPMGSEHSGKGIQYLIHKPSLNHEPGREYWDAIYGPAADVTSSSDRGSGIPPVEACYRGSTTTKAGILQPTLYNSQEDWRPPTRLRLAETQYSHVTKSPFIQDLGPALGGQQITEGWPDDIEMSSDPCQWLCFQGNLSAPSTQTQGSVPIEVKIMDINSVSNRFSNPESTLLKDSADIMDGLLFLHKTPEIEAFTDASNITRIVGCSILVYSDNTTTLSYVKKFGGTKSSKILELSETVVKLGGRREQADCSNRMISIPRDIYKFKLSTRLTRCRPVCFLPEQEGRHILQLVSGPQSHRTECTDTQLRENNHDAGYSDVKIGNMVSGSSGFLGVSTAITSINNSCSRSQKRKVSVLMLLTLSFPTNDVSDVDPDISAPQIINYLAELFTNKKLKIGTIKAYKSAILKLSDSPSEISMHPMFSGFIKVLDDSSIRSFVRPEIDISPILELFREWGPTPNLSVKQLTSKLYWLLAEKVACNLCPTPHANNNMWTDQDTLIPKGRAIGATLAANSGVSTDNIVSHAFWSNYLIFDSYYRLTRNSSNYLTESILNLE
ncbi:hypothetical protein BB561_005414 [Smittium simulii]|uniref:Uncharacterized protein n=1 Tax=Smittium simulii TaxID=133385 RepID=A0A2T9YAI3_9FUNG|nr:hypothetical protein BB561_005414 [Smittium simulii]